MTFNPSYTELMGREQYKIRLKEAEHERLIKTFTLANPSPSRKIWLIFRDRWSNFWNRKQTRKNYPPITGVEGKSHSL